MAKRNMFMLAGAAVRLAYGWGALLAPRAMARHGLAPALADDPEARLALRGFGGQQISLGGFTALAARSERLARPVLLLNAAVDTLDLTAGALELQARQGMDRTVAGTLAINALGLTWWSLALAGLRDR